MRLDGSSLIMNLIFITLLVPSPKHPCCSPHYPYIHPSVHHATQPFSDVQMPNPYDLVPMLIDPKHGDLRGVVVLGDRRGGRRPQRQGRRGGAVL